MPTSEADVPGAGERSLRHVPGLDGLRGLAVAAVVAYHLGWLSGGFLGVDVFFVLSGYLVTSLVVAEVGRTGRLGLRTFWVRRLRRLVPAVLVVVPATLIGALLVDWSPTQRGALVVDGLATLTWWANWRQLAGTSYWAPGPSPFRHAWSLSVEEQFYLVWPIVVVAVVALGRRRGRSIRPLIGSAAAAGAALSAAWMVLLSRSTDAADLSRVYLGTDTRILAPLIGCGLACWSPGRGLGLALTGRARPALLAAGHLAAIGLVVAAATVQVSDPGLYRSGGFILVALATAVLLRALAEPSEDEGHRRSLLDVAGWLPLRYLGLRSYALYLWSWPLQVLLQYWRPTWSRVSLTVAVVIGSLVAAELSHRLVEQPLRRGSGWARCPVVRRSAWALGVAGCAVALLVVQDRALPVPAFERIETEEAVERASHAPPPDPADPDDLEVMVIGDSVAFMATYHAPPAEDLPGIGTIDGRGVIGCGILAADRWEYPVTDRPGAFDLSAGGNCVGQAEAEAVGLTGDPDVVLLIGGAWEWSSARSPDGQVLEARSPAMERALVDALLVRARQAHQAGAAFVVAQWACPGEADAPERRDRDYVAWINGVFARAVGEAVGEGITAAVTAPTDDICEGGEATAAPTPAWRAATGNEVHLRDRDAGQLLWGRWLAPALLKLAPTS